MRRIRTSRRPSRSKLMEYVRGQTIRARVTTLRRLARWADAAIRSWELIESCEQLDGSFGPLDSYRPYLVVDAHGHRELGLLYLNSMFEKRSDTVNIIAVSKHLRSHGVAIGLLDEIDADVAAHTDQLAKLRRLRGGAVAHRSGAQSYDETFAAVKMTLENLDSLLSLASRCSLALARAINLPAEPLHINPVDTLRSMLSALSDAEKRNQESSPFAALFKA